MVQKFRSTATAALLRHGPADIAAFLAEDVIENGFEDQTIGVTLTALGDESTPPTFRIDALPANGMLYNGIPELGGTPILAGTDYVGGAYWNGAWTWTIQFVPDPDWAGETGFGYTARFGAGAADPATATISLAPLVDTPVVDANVHDQPDPLGTLRNASGTSGQEDGPALAALDGGRTIIVWQQGLGPSAVKARIHGADGLPEGAAFDVPASGGASKVQPSVASRPDGSFAISWVEGGSGTGGGDVRTTFYAPGATAPALVVTSAASSSGREADPIVTALGDGFLVTWAVESGGGANHLAQRYGASGAAIGAPFLIASGAAPGSFTGTFFDPDPYAVAAVGSGGAFAIVTTHGDIFISGTRLELVMVGADGSVGAPLQFGSGGTLPSIATLPQGGFVVVWAAKIDLGGFSQLDVVAQKFDADGSPAGDPIAVAANGADPTVAALPDGRFVVGWTGDGVAGSRDIFAQVFAADGTPANGGPLAVTATGDANTDPFGFPRMIEESQPVIAVRTDGAFTLGWLQTRATGGTNPDVFLRSFDPGIAILHGFAGTPIDLPTIIGLVDGDGSERLIQLRVSGLPEGFILEAGGRAGGDPAGDWIVDRSTPAGIALLDALGAGEDALTVTSPDDFTGPLTIEIRATSQEMGDPESVAESAPGLVPMVIEPGPPDDVVNTVPARYDFAEDDVAQVLNGLAVTDPDDEGGDYTVQFTAGHGTLSIDTAGFASTVLVAGNDGGNGITLRGPLAEINAALAAGSLRYAPDPDYNGEDRLTVFSFEGVAGDAISMTPATLPSSLSGTASMVTADLNADGLLDLVYVTNQLSPGRVGIRLGLPGNAFAAETVLATGLVSAEVIVGQFNPSVDSVPDIAVANFWNTDASAQGGLSLFFGNGDGSFGAQQLVQDGTARAAQDLLSGDFDRDGRPDIVVARGTTGQGVLYRANGDGSFAAASPFALSLASQSTSSIVAGDVDNDGRLDIVAFNPGPGATDTITLVRGAGTGAFAAPVEIAGGLNGLAGGTLADLDNDGNLDLVSTATNQLSIRFGRGDGTFDAAIDVSMAGANVVAAGDVNGDGIADLLVGSGLGTVRVLRGNGDGSFQAPTNVTVHAGPESIAVADLDGDGDNDIAVANNNILVTVAINGTANRGDVDTVAIHVAARNDAPIAVNGTNQALSGIAEDSPSATGQSILDLLQGHFSDEADDQAVFGGSLRGTLSGIAIVSGGTSAAGAWQWLDGGAWTDIGAASPGGAVLLGEGVMLRFNPAVNMFGAAPPLDVRLIDDSAAFADGDIADLSGAGATGGTTAFSADIVSLTQQVAAVNDAPSGADGQVSGGEGGTIVFAWADFGFSDPVENDRPLGIVIDRLPDQGVLRLDGITVDAGSLIGFAEIAAGLFVFAPDPDEYGEEYASFTFSVRDAGGGADTDPEPNRIAIEILPLPPSAHGESYKVVEDGALIAVPSVLANDRDDDPLTAVLVDGPDHAASFALHADGTFTYLPAADFNGTDSFTYKANDGGIDSNVATVILIVTPVRDAPVATGESYTVIEDVPLVVGGPGVLNNDGDADGDALTAQLVAGPAHALAFTLEADGSFGYTPAADFSGPDSFSYRPFDGALFGNIVTVHLDVIADEDAAIARDDGFATPENGTLAGNVFADNGDGADSDPDGPLTVASVNGAIANVGQTIALASGATVRLNADGNFLYDPSGRFDTLTSLPTGAANIGARDSFSYGLAGGGTGTVTIQVDGQRTIADLLIGSAGNDAITDAGFNFSDSFMLQQGGNDTASGLGGNDGFYFGSQLNALDSVDGGTGTDSVAIQGNYAALVLGNIVNVENLVPLAGNNTSFGDLAGNVYAYHITTNDANVAAGATLSVIGGNLRVGEDLTFNGAAETDGVFRIFAGQGTDALIGGAKNDGFFFGADGNLTGGDIVNGGGGTDSIALRGNYTVALHDGSMTGVEVLTFLSGHTNEFGGMIDPAGLDYDLATADGNVAAGQRLDVIATNLRANESLRFDGRAESDGSFRLLSGAGDDTLFGGGEDDILYGNRGADRLEGGAGADTYLYRFFDESLAGGRDLIVWGAGDRIDLGRVDAVASSGINEAFAFIGADGFSGIAGELRVAAIGADAMIEADVDGNGVADLVIFVQGHVPVAGDFVL